MESKFKVGDVVKYKAGSLRLVVIDVEKRKNGLGNDEYRYTCTWEYKGEHRCDDFEEAELGFEVGNTEFIRYAPVTRPKSTVNYEIEGE